MTTDDSCAHKRVEVGGCEACPFARDFWVFGARCNVPGDHPGELWPWEEERWLGGDAPATSWRPAWCPLEKEPVLVSLRTRSTEAD